MLLFRFTGHSEVDEGGQGSGGGPRGHGQHPGDHGQLLDGHGERHQAGVRSQGGGVRAVHEERGAHVGRERAGNTGQCRAGHQAGGQGGRQDEQAVNSPPWKDWNRLECVIINWPIKENRFIKLFRYVFLRLSKVQLFLIKKSTNCRISSIYLFQQFF